ncbi:MAG TPA: polyhydroxyalkanoate synthesis repressor PhaR [Croceibacterium sp.]|nr:polyhydroxyalkanoate synthesis repressor PhaR [Croceibacterium sp.]
MAKRDKDDDGRVVIKKYANRRLYNTASSSYITLEDLARMVREGTDFVVLDAKTGADITHQILTQIIMDEEASGGEQMLPVSFLRDLISMYGNSMQAMMPHYLQASMENFRANQGKLQDTFKTSLGPDAFAKIAETNMAMFKAAASAFMPKAGGANGPAADPDDELAALKQQMAEMQERLARLGK